MTIVLADMDASFLDRLQRRLEKIRGVKVVGESSNSNEATAMILNRNPDVAIVNSMLQGGSGIEVLRHIRQLMVPPTIIVVTENPSLDNKHAYTVAGADFFFDKTTEERKLITTVRRLCVPQGRIEASDVSLRHVQ
jgi:DNA-binding NarL/FixJ family response regulator